MSLSVYKDSFFGSTHLPANKVLLIAYLWLTKTLNTAMITQVGVGSATITNWANHLGCLVAWCLDLADAPIGGEGIIVEIDESKFGKRKYNRGHRVEGIWVVGGDEITPQRRMFAVSVQDRTADTLGAIIQEHVLPGTIVRTDLWRGYRALHDFGMEHQTVNHTEHFVDPVTGVYTNTIEGTWNGMKMHICRQHFKREFIDGALMEFIWRRRYADDLWNRLLHAMQHVIYDADADAENAESIDVNNDV
jgi:transposase-like protein